MTGKRGQSSLGPVTEVNLAKNAVVIEAKGAIRAKLLPLQKGERNKKHIVGFTNGGFLSDK